MQNVCLPLGIFGAMILIIAAIVVPIFVIAGSGARRRKKYREYIVQTQIDILRRGRWFPVRYASSKKFYSWFKFFPWEASGVLLLLDREIIFFCDKLRKERNITMRFRVGDFKAEWIGSRDFLRNGITSWFEIENLGEKHYFTCETGTTIFGSEGGTRKIYDEMVRYIREVW